uniref:Glucosaminyl (N-acetyl) transferase 4 n=1 Tax=Sinocyclocheilus grahami TaxID=75366 RepID=A0A672SC54_SINGR
MKGLARCIPNVFIASKLERVQYAGISRLKADLNCLSDLLDSEVKWKYVINLCGQDFPLRTNAELVSDLTELKGRNMVESKWPGGKTGRWSVHYLLKSNNSEYYESPVSTREMKSPPPHNIDMFVGSAYFTLSREFVRDFPLAFSLVVHQDVALVERLLRAIYMPHNIYCIHYDLKSSDDFISAMKGLARCIPNVFIASKLERVQYAGISRLKADLNCLSDLLDSEVKWKYVINLCGQDFPLRTNAELVSDLTELKGRNMVESKWPGGKTGRWSVHYLLKSNNSEYYESPVSTREMKSPPPHNIEMFVGSAYFTLSREFVFFVHQSLLARDFLAWSKDTYSPDEHFWATLIRVPGVPGEVPRSDPEISELISKTRLVKWSYLERILYPPCTGASIRSVCIYGAAELRWLLNYGHWFANKVDPKVDPVLMECLEEILSEKQLRPKLGLFF